MRLIDINCPNCGCKIHVEPEPEPQWIPCSERLPEEEEDFLVTDEVIAWMPLPEPYRKDGD